MYEPLATYLLEYSKQQHCLFFLQFSQRSFMCNGFGDHCIVSDGCKMQHCAYVWRRIYGDIKSVLKNTRCSIKCQFQCVCVHTCMCVHAVDLLILTFATFLGNPMKSKERPVTTRCTQSAGCTPSKDEKFLFPSYFFLYTAKAIGGIFLR